MPLIRSPRSRTPTRWLAHTMLWMRAIVLLGIGGLGVVNTGRAQACAYAPGRATEASERAVAVFIGRVISTTPTPKPAIGEERTAVFVVLRAIKGTHARDTVRIRYDAITRYRLDFAQGDSALVFAMTSPNGGLMTGGCAGTAALACAARELAELHVPIPKAIGPCRTRGIAGTD